MLERIPRFWKGYVKIRLESPMPERFLSLCAHHQILLWNLRNSDLYYEMELSVRDFFRIKSLRRKTGSRIVLLEKHGMPFFFQRNQKRKAFFLGIGLGMALLFLCSFFIWDIRVEGNHYNSNEAVLHLLEKFQIRDGIWKKEVDCQEIAAKIREGFPNVVWVSAKIEGTCLLIEMKENEDSYQQPNTSEKETTKEQRMPGQDLVAERDGVIVKMVTRSGRPLVQEGMECRKGQVLVSGQLEILNNEAQVQRYEYVNADADIWIRTDYAYYDEFSLAYKKKIYQEEKTYGMLRLFGQELTLWRGKKQQAEIYRREVPVYLTSSFCLPISYGTIRVRPYKTMQKEYQKEEAGEIAGKNLQKFLKKLVEEGMEVLDQEMQMKISGKKCITRGRITVEKQIKKTVPTERTQEPDLESDP